ncbi:MAG: DUF1614 domain-containing protein [Planctomycetales bacterium]|nr:DUF1614 domain-containing protein [Planctomycetales bacterium]
MIFIPTTFVGKLFLVFGLIIASWVINLLVDSLFPAMFKINRHTGDSKFWFVNVDFGGCVLPVLFAVFLVALHLEYERTDLMFGLVLSVLGASATAFLGTVRTASALYVNCLPVGVAAGFCAAICIRDAGSVRFVCAFSGGVLGTFIGSDLLSLGYFRHIKQRDRIVIGGGGHRDAILWCGLIAALVS